MVARLRRDLGYLRRNAARLWTAVGIAQRLSNSLLVLHLNARLLIGELRGRQLLLPLLLLDWKSLRGLLSLLLRRFNSRSFLHLVQLVLRLIFVEVLDGWKEIVSHLRD